MDPSKLVDIILGNASVPQDELSPNNKASIILGAFEVFRKSIDDMMCHRFSEWSEWKWKMYHELLEFENLPSNFPWINEKTRVAIVHYSSDFLEKGIKHHVIGVTNKGKAFLFTFFSHQKSQNFRTCESLNIQELDESVLSIFFEEKKGELNNILRGLVLLSQEAVVTREHRLAHSQKTRDQLCRIATRASGGSLFKNGYGWHFG